MALDGPQADDDLLEVAGLPLAVQRGLLDLGLEILVDRDADGLVVRADLPPLVAEFGLPSG